jgi:protoporphyrinogen oxidase
MNEAPKVGIVGGGILGSVLALRLAEAGAAVTLLERAPTLGGLAGALDFGGHTVDRFYHVIVPSDERMIATAQDLGLGDELRFSPVGVGFLRGGKLHDLNGISDFLRFKPLTPYQRARLAWFVAYCQLRSSYAGLEHVPLERWLRRHCGRGVTDRIWRPLLDSRFDSDHDELPATYMWARTRRMSSARTGGERRETMGCLVGGHQRLVDAIARRAQRRGVQLRLGAAVEELWTDESGAVRGVYADGERLAFDLTIPTLQPPALRGLLGHRHSALLEAYPRRYLGVVCVLIKARRSLSPYYAVNICDPTPMTTVVEASHVVGTEHLDGQHLLYLPKYCAPDAPEQTEDDESVYRRFTDMLARVSPGFDRERDVAAWTVQRARLVEPVHALGHQPRVAPVWPGVRGLGLASNAQVYPRLLNGESVMALAEDVAAQAAERLGLVPGATPLARPELREAA